MQIAAFKRKTGIKIGLQACIFVAWCSLPYWCLHLSHATDIYWVTFPLGPLARWDISITICFLEPGVLHESLEKQQIIPNRDFFFQTAFFISCFLLELHQDILSARTVHKKAMVAPVSLVFFAIKMESGF